MQICIISASLWASWTWAKASLRDSFWGSISKTHPNLEAHPCLWHEFGKPLALGPAAPGLEPPSTYSFVTIDTAHPGHISVPLSRKQCLHGRVLWGLTTMYPAQGMDSWSCPGDDHHGYAYLSGSSKFNWCWDLTNDGNQWVHYHSNNHIQEVPYIWTFKLWTFKAVHVHPSVPGMRDPAAGPPSAIADHPSAPPPPTFPPPSQSLFLPVHRCRPLSAVVLDCCAFQGTVLWD